MAMTISILGSGSSPGVPVIGCKCKICKSRNNRNHRLRSSLLITTHDKKNIVFDTSPDFRAQMLGAGIEKLEAVVYTHTHSDHCHGFDDLRAFYFHSLKPVPCYIHTEHVEDLRERFIYAFRKDGYQGTKPQVLLKPFGSRSFKISGLTFEPSMASHGDQNTAVFRVGSFAYATDFKKLDAKTIKKWRGSIHTMVASGLKFGEHPTHSTIEETLDLFDDLGVERGIITHLGHEVDYDKHGKHLPKGRLLAFDGMKVTVS